MKEYFSDYEQVVKDVDSTLDGITTIQAEERQAKSGKNLLPQAPKVPLIVRFFKQMADPMVIVLLVAAVLSAVTAIYEGEGFADVIIILAVVLLNATLGVLQEGKAEKAIEALQKMSASTCKVMRDGKLKTIKSEDLCVGDVVILEAGDAIPADGRLIEAARMKVEEAALTGESVPSNKEVTTLATKEKDIPLGDRKNMVYMGCTVVYGRGKAVITAIANETEMGKIAGVIAATKEGKTPLQVKLGQLSRILTYAVVGICVLIFAVKLIVGKDFSVPFLMDSFMIAISLAVAAIPEGLSTVVTIVLSIGVTNMSKKNAIVRRLTAVETLGCAQVICSDKTGTLTQNKMTVVDKYTTDEKLLAKVMALSSDAILDDNNMATGEPTECALVNYAYKLNINKTQVGALEPRVDELPFDSLRKMMSTMHSVDGKFSQYTKGALDEILKICSHYLVDGKVVKLTDDLRATILAANKKMADKALRVLGGAYKTFETRPETMVEDDMTFIGFVGMIDPVREEVKASIVECRQAGIKPIMITGDHKDTAFAIAKELGIVDSIDQVMTGAELDELSDEEFRIAVKKHGVYARVKPENKVRIVTMWKELGYVCAMTGDGVNDAPSIKSADIGIGMGITGTDVTKNVADIVLADDNFATIVCAVKEGRIIFDNIKKSIQFLLSSNLSEVVSIFTATLMGFVILKPVHILWINLITDTFPALALGMESGEKDIMTKQPRDKKESLFANNMGADVIWQGIMLGALTILAYFIGHFMESGVWEIANSPDGMTMAFLTLSMAEIFHSFNLRSSHTSLFLHKKQNKYLWGSLIVSLLLTSLVIFVPGLNRLFSLEPINFKEYLTALLLAFSVIPVVEIVKLFRNVHKKRLAKKALQAK